MKREALSLLDEWCEGEGVHTSPGTLKLFKECCRLLGMPEEFHREISSSNFRRKARVLRTKRKTASRAFAAALLNSRDYEDARRYAAAIGVFEKFKSQTDAKFFLAIAQHEIDRIRRLSKRTRR